MACTGTTCTVVHIYPRNRDDRIAEEQGWTLPYFETCPIGQVGVTFRLSEMKIHLPKLFWLILIVTAWQDFLFPQLC